MTDKPKVKRKAKPDKDGKENDIQRLKGKLADRKEQVRRLKHEIRELQKLLESEGKAKPKKERKKKEDIVDPKKAIIEKFKKVYSNGQEKEEKITNDRTRSGADVQGSQDISDS